MKGDITDTHTLTHTHTHTHTHMCKQSLHDSTECLYTQDYREPVNFLTLAAVQSLVLCKWVSFGTHGVDFTTSNYPVFNSNGVMCWQTNTWTLRIKHYTTVDIILGHACSCISRVKSDWWKYLPTVSSILGFTERMQTDLWTPLQVEWRWVSGCLCHQRKTSDVPLCRDLDTCCQPCQLLLSSKSLMFTGTLSPSQKDFPWNRVYAWQTYKHTHTHWA